jgi:hypothetical protein
MTTKPLSKIMPDPAELIIHLHGGAELRSSNRARAAENGEDVAYWDVAEFAEDAPSVIGALMGALARQQDSNLAEFTNG